MGLTIFYGWTADELLAELRKAQNQLISGAATIASGSGDVNRQVQIQATAKERISMIQQALYELDPDTYADFSTVGHNQTQGAFS